ncbi:unnamed protein product [Schistosoma turkestanicum]|nr:unnamed protein product [Schistosoma turkestanicum]
MRLVLHLFTIVHIIIPLLFIHAHNKSFNKSINSVNHTELTSIINVGPPRNLMLDIACDQLRPCIKSSWLPPVEYEKDNINHHQHEYANKHSNKNGILAYRLRYRIIYPIELSQINAFHVDNNNNNNNNNNNDKSHAEINYKLFSKIIEKNITGLQYTSNPGEHLLGVIYEVSVAAITKNGYGQEIASQIAIPESAPSDAPSNFRVVGGNQTSVQLAWEPPRLLYRNGIITKYQVRCYIVGEEENPDELKTLTEQTLKLINLPTATHACLVRAWTKAGPGPWSDRIQIIINQKGPSPPFNIQVYWKTQQVLTVKWTLPEDKANIAYLIIHYAKQTNPNLWHKYFVKDLKTTDDLINLNSNDEYLIRLSSVDLNGNEGDLSDIINTNSHQHLTLVNNNNNNHNDNHNMNNKRNQHFIFMDIPDQPEKFTVQNFKCVHKTMNSITIEWLPPIHLANLIEYQLHLSGRSEFITSNGVLKSIHLDEIQLHKNIHEQIDTNGQELLSLNWPLMNMMNSITDLDNYHYHSPQQTHKMQISNLKPNSQYKITIRPIYRALITEGNLGTKDGIPITILCHTEWSAPDYIKPPELLAIYAGPSDPEGPTSIIEVKLYRVSEENGPIHNYYVIISPELNTVTSNQNVPLKSSNSLIIDASQYDLRTLSQNNDLPSYQAPYLALARHTIDLFEPNHGTAIIILGSEEIDNFILENQYYLHSTTSGNQTNDRSIKKTTDLRSYFPDDHSHIYESDSHTNKINENKPYYYNVNSNMFTKVIQTNNKRLFQSTIYRFALRACSQYSDGRQLCATSQWSDRISPINPTKLNTLSKLKSLKTKLNEWSSHESSSSSFTIILTGLSSGLIFFAILSTILGCILKRRKQQLNRRSLPETNTNNHLCKDFNKSIFNEKHLLTTSNSMTKCYSSTINEENIIHKNNVLNSKPSSYFLNLPIDGSNSPLHSNNNNHTIPILNFSYSNNEIQQPISPLSLSSSNQLTTISDLSPTITRSIYAMNNNNKKSESPTRSVNSNELINAKTMHHIQSKYGKTNILENFNQLVCDGTLEIHRMPIPVEQFQEIVYQARNNNSFQQEFQTIEQISLTRYISAVHSNLDINRAKNRYPNILAYDCTRVNIQSNYQHHANTAQHGIMTGSDYINANYIDGYRKQCAYIATQAPLPNTFDHFWTMIWEQNTSVIVMLTKLIENGQIKSDQYWPNSGVLIFADKLIVTHLETNELANYIIRCFELKKDNEHRKIWHLQYTSWPDQEVPSYSTVFLMFLRRVGTITPNDCGPIVVHCSSGTGRTGVYIAMNILLERMKNESMIDIFGLVNQLRTQRNYLIETPEQYQFLYNALLESITDGNTEVSARNLYTHLQHLSMLQTTTTTTNTTYNNTNNSSNNTNDLNSTLSTTTIPTTPLANSLNEISNNITAATNSLGLTGFQLEFRKINKLSPNTTLTSNYVQSKTGFIGYTPPGSPVHGYKLSVSCDAAKQSVNLNKNRLVSIVPFDWNRVTLCSIRGVDGSDYINASLIDGYLKKNAYIACQGPMISTVEDFWRMVWEKHSCLIVMLCSVKEGGKEKCFTYWPEDKPSRYQFLVIDLLAQHSMSNYILREFKLTDTRDGESRTIKQLQYIHWNEQGLPQTSESLIDLIGHVHKIKEQYHCNDGPITVHCSSGAGRTGLFITMCNVLERLRQESVVDMYQTVKLLRQQRVWMVQTEEQYRFCYTTTLDYLNSFDLCTQPQLLIQTTNNLQLNSPKHKVKMKSSQFTDKNVVFELDKNYESINNNNLVKQLN